MIRLTLFETGKIIKKKSFWIGLIILAVINIFLLWYVNLPKEMEPKLSAYKAFQRDISGMSEDEKSKYVKDMYEKMDLKNPACVIDANHSNSNKQFKEQIRITKEVMHSRKLSPDLHKLVKGVMIESYIEEGNQKVGAGCYGKSITDPCLGWEDSERLIYDIAEYE